MNCPARIVGAIVLLALGSGCAPAPIRRPIKVGDVDTGANSVEAVRRQFQGTWTLDNDYVDGGTRRVEEEPVMRADRVDVSSV